MFSIDHYLSILQFITGLFCRFFFLIISIWRRSVKISHFGQTLLCRTEKWSPFNTMSYSMFVYVLWIITGINCPNPSPSTSTTVSFPSPEIQFPDINLVTTITYSYSRIGALPTVIDRTTSTHTLTGFPVGVTVVTATAMDSDGNTVSCSFTYTVLPSVGMCNGSVSYFTFDLSFCFQTPSR